MNRRAQANPQPRYDEEIYVCPGWRNNIAAPSLAVEVPYNVHLDRWQTEPPDPYRDNLERFGKGGFGS